MSAVAVAVAVVHQRWRAAPSGLQASAASGPWAARRAAAASDLQARSAVNKKAPRAEHAGLSCFSRGL